MPTPLLRPHPFHNVPAGQRRRSTKSLTSGHILHGRTGQRQYIVVENERNCEILEAEDKVWLLLIFGAVAGHTVCVCVI